MKIQDDFDFSGYDVNLQEFAENVRHILNFGLYDVKYQTLLIPDWTPGPNTHPIVLAKIGEIGNLFIGDANVASGWWYVTLTQLAL